MLRGSLSPLQRPEGDAVPHCLIYPALSMRPLLPPEVGHECVEEGSTVTRVPPSL